MKRLVLLPALLATLSILVVQCSSAGNDVVAKRTVVVGDLSLDIPSRWKPADVDPEDIRRGLEGQAPNYPKNFFPTDVVAAQQFEMVDEGARRLGLLNTQVLRLPEPFTRLPTIHEYRKQHEATLAEVASAKLVDIQQDKRIANIVTTRIVEEYPDKSRSLRIYYWSPERPSQYAIVTFALFASHFRAATAAVELAVATLRANPR